MKHLLDDTVLTFGKYEGEKPNDIATDDPSYIVWLYENVNPKVCTQRLYDICEDGIVDSWEESQELDDLHDMHGW